MSAKRYAVREDVSFDLVADTFNLPIVEASITLGRHSAAIIRNLREIILSNASSTSIVRYNSFTHSPILHTFLSVPPFDMIKVLAQIFYG